MRSTHLIPKLFSVGALALLAATGASARPLANSVTFQASLPEDVAAPAIATVVVSNDDNGLLTFQTGIANRPQLAADDHYAVFLDTDSNANTGDTVAEGAEYAIAVDSGRADLGRWNGSDYDYSTPQSSLVFTYANGPVLKINASELGSPPGFNFFVAALTDATGSGPHVNFAPPAGHGTWSYQIKITPLVLSFVRFDTTPAKPKAGQAFAASMVVGANRPDALTQGADVSCAAAVGGRAVKVAATGFANGVARCAWQLPRSAKGKTISGSVEVSYPGLKVSHRFSARVG